MLNCFAWIFAMRLSTGRETILSVLRSIARGNVSSCVREKWGAEQALYEEGGLMHVAVTGWPAKKCTTAKMRHYTRARETFMSETFHSVINKFAPKRIHFQKSHHARMACGALD